MTIGSLDDAVATIDSGDWSEAAGAVPLDHPACHLTTDMFADLFGRLAGAPVAVLEVECPSSGARRGRFLVGSPEIMDAVYEEMGRGVPYDAAVRALLDVAEAGEAASEAGIQAARTMEKALAIDVKLLQAALESHTSELVLAAGREESRTVASIIIYTLLALFVGAARRWSPTGSSHPSGPSPRE